MKLCKTFLYIAFWGCLLFFCVVNIEAQTNNPPKSTSSDIGIRSWEYCVIYRTLNGQHTLNEQTKEIRITGIAIVSYLDETGERDENVEIVMPENSKDYPLAIRRALGKAFTKLGSEGWEFVGRFPYAPVYSNEPELGFVFKRPKK